MNGIPNSKKIENETLACHNVRRVPVIRSISTTADAQRPMSPVCGSTMNGQHHGSLDRIDNFSSLDLPSSLPMSNCFNYKPTLTPVDHCSISSGYDSNSSSSLSFLSGSSTNRRNSQSAHRYLLSNYPIESIDDKINNDRPHGTTHDALLTGFRPKRQSLCDKSIKEEVIQTLDRIEKRIAFLREVAVELSEEKLKLLDALTQVNNCCSLNPFTEGNIHRLFELFAFD